MSDQAAVTSSVSRDKRSHSDQTESITSEFQTSYASDRDLLSPPSDTHAPDSLRSRSTRDIFNQLSAAIPQLRPLDSAARTATRAERKITFLGGCRLYPKAMAWSMLISSTLIMEGFDTFLIVNFFGLPAFQRAYGVPTKGSGYQIPSRWQFGLSTAKQAGEIIGLLLNGLLADYIGLHGTLTAALIVLFIFVFIPFFAVNIQMLLAGQILCGIPWGVFQTLSINYAAEVMPVSLRAYLLSSMNLCYVLGQLLATGITRIFVNNESQWSYRIPFALQWAISVPIFIAVLFAPESPWWLIRHDRPGHARRVLLRLTTKGTVNVDETVTMMTHTNEVEKYLKNRSGISYFDCFKGTDLRRTEITCLVWVTQQICGISLSGWASFFYEQAGFHDTNAFNLSVGTYGVAVVGCVIAWMLLPRVGRRKLYLGGLIALFILLLVTGSVGAAPESRGQSWALGTLLILLTFVYNITIGPVCFVLVAELPSTRLRLKTVVLARVAYNLIGILVSWMTPQMLSPTAWNWKGKSAFFFAGTTLLAFLLCYWRLPETYGLSYLEIDVLFERKAKASKFRELQMNLESIGYFSVDGGESQQPTWRGY